MMIKQYQFLCTRSSGLDPSLDSIKVGNDLIPFSGSATNLGVIMMRHSPTMIMIRKFASPYYFI